MKALLDSFVLVSLVSAILLPSCSFADGSDRESVVIGTRYSIVSAVLDQSREIMVYVPSDRGRSYPVIYVLNADTEFLTTVAAVENLSVNSNKMPGLIVVGVVPIDGAQETRPSFPKDGSVNEYEKSFRQFVATELVDHIDATHDTLPYRILAGHSLSGLFVLNTLRSKSDRFDAYFAFSPALWWDDGSEAVAIEQSILKAGTTARALAVTVADEGAESLALHRDFIAKLESQSSSTYNLLAAEFPDETHGSTTLPAMNWALRTLFAGWRPDSSVYRSGLPGLEEHYSGLSTRFGWEIQVPLEDLPPLIFEFARRGNSGDALRVSELVDYVLERDSSMGAELLEMRGALEIQGHVGGAEVLEQALCISDPAMSNCQD